MGIKTDQLWFFYTELNVMAQFETFANVWAGPCFLKLELHNISSFHIRIWYVQAQSSTTSPNIVKGFLSNKRGAKTNKKKYLFLFFWTYSSMFFIGGISLTSIKILLYFSANISLLLYVPYFQIFKKYINITLLCRDCPV